MKNSRIILLLALFCLSSVAFADDCGTKDYIGREHVGARFFYVCNDSLIPHTNPFCNDSQGNKYPATYYGLQPIYDDVHDFAPEPNWRLRVTDSPRGYSYVKLYNTSIDDNGIESKQWYVDGVAKSTSSSLKLIQRRSDRSKGQPSIYSIKLTVTDSFGHVCSKQRSVRVSGPTCNASESNVGCNTNPDKYVIK